MDYDPLGPSSALDRELIELPPGSGSDIEPSDVVLVLVRPVAHLRSPVASHRSSGPVPAPASTDPDRPGIDLPPVGALRRPVALAMLPAATALALAGWQFAVAVGAAAFLIRQLDKRAPGVSFQFADGFLPYRSRDGWPRGVQEDDDVRWNWSSAPSGHGTPG